MLSANEFSAQNKSCTLLLSWGFTGAVILRWTTQIAEKIYNTTKKQDNTHPIEYVIIFNESVDVREFSFSNGFCSVIEKRDYDKKRKVSLRRKPLSEAHD